MVIVSGEDNLLEVVLALGATGRFARLLHRGQKQRHKDRNDRDYNQQFDQGKATRPAVQGTHVDNSIGRAGKVGKTPKKAGLLFCWGSGEKKSSRC
jgi:hypothetical protein